MRRQKKVHYSKRKAAIFLSIICAAGIVALALSISLSAPQKNKETVLVHPSESSQTQEQQNKQENKPLDQKPAAEKPIEREQSKPSVSQQKPIEKPAEQIKESAQKPSTPTEKPPEAAVSVPVPHKGTLIFVLDDAGNNLHDVDPFLDLPFDLTIAILPGLADSVAVAEKIRKSGKELILHNPMQAKNLELYPGPNSIQPTMNAEETRVQTLANLREVGPVVGMNNHEGSLITESELHMNEILDICKEQGIYFLDSRTTAQTVSPKLAAVKDMRLWQRSIFIDNTQIRADMEAAIANGAALAEKNGTTILIGHVWSDELPQILTEQHAKLTKEGFTFSTISRTMNE